MDFDARKCPSCGSRNTRPRSGVGFEHERLCFTCNESWDPSEEYQNHLERERERLGFNAHRE